jgi:hypothetical protein
LDPPLFPFPHPSQDYDDLLGPETLLASGLKKRRELRGAAGSDAFFDAMFAEYKTAVDADFAAVTPMAPDRTYTIVQDTARLQAKVSETMPSWGRSSARLPLPLLSPLSSPSHADSSHLPLSHEQQRSLNDFRFLKWPSVTTTDTGCSIAASVS